MNPAQVSKNPRPPCIAIRASLMVLCLGICACGNSHRPADDSQFAPALRRLHWEFRTARQLPEPATRLAHGRGIEAQARGQRDASPPTDAKSEENFSNLPETGIGTATLSWNPPTAALEGSAFHGLSGYRIDYGRNPAVLERAITIDNPGITRYVIENLPPGKWYFRVTAFDAEGNQSVPTSIGTKDLD